MTAVDVEASITVILAAYHRRHMYVVVIGAGAFGSWTALWLRRRGASVKLVDQYAGQLAVELNPSAKDRSGGGLGARAEPIDEVDDDGLADLEARFELAAVGVVDLALQPAELALKDVEERILLIGGDIEIHGRYLRRQE
jgi:glycine/D-amino acid oxidase-like deaminating enzyme